jgi:hypothetical protein
MRMTPPVSAQMPAAQKAARLFSSEPTRKRSPERDLHQSEQHARAGTLTLEFVAGPESAEDVRKSREQDHDREQIDEHRLSDDVEAFVEEHDEPGDDARTPGHKRDASGSFADQRCADADDPGERPEGTHVGREVVARLLGLNDHRGPGVSARTPREKPTR